MANWNIVELFILFITILFPSINAQCSPRICQEIFEEVHNSIDFSKNPCKNFYKYACGNWQKNNQLERYRVYSISVDSKIQSNARNILRLSLQAKQNQPEDSHNSTAVQYAVDLYKECMRRDTIERLGVKPLRRLIHSMVGPWPTFHTDSSTRDWMDSFVNCYCKAGISPIFPISVDQLMTKTNINLNCFDVPKTNECGLPKRNAFYIRTIELITGVNSSPKLEKAVDEVREFVVLVCKNTYRQMSSDNISLEEFKRSTNFDINWTLLVNNIIDTLETKIPLRNDSNYVVVRGINYYTSVSRLITETPNHVINNYLGLMAAISLAKFGNDRLFDIFKQTADLLNDDLIWERCVKQVIEVLPLPTSRLYLDNKPCKLGKKMVNELIKNLIKSFNNTLKENTWLDNESKKSAITKLNYTNYHVAYPRGIFHNPSLDKMSGIKKQSRIKMGSSGQKNDRTVDVWLEMAPHTANAWYIPKKNTFVISAAFLQSPYFRPQWPSSMKYGAIGFFIGHEMTHGFDNNGRQFDKYGNYKNWWTEKSKRQFVKKANCFVRQYTFDDLTSGIRHNGAATLQENIADNGGFRQSYKAYQNYISLNPDQRNWFSSYTKFTSDQLFFISFAQTLCSVNHPDMIEYKIRNGVHSLDNYRINIVLKNNFKEFSRAFNCSTFAKIKNIQKCKVW